VDFVTQLGLPAMHAHDCALTNAFLAGLRDVPGVQVLTPSDPAARAGMVTFRLLGRDNRQVADALTRRRQRVRSVTEAGLDAVRASFHVCNTPEQVEELLVAVEDLAAGE
jgi:selenocysteine lyase/cysteine desulfurase